MKKLKKNNGIWIVILLILAAITIVIGSKFSLMPTQIMQFTLYNYDDDPAYKEVTDSYLRSNTARLGEYAFVNTKIELVDGNWGCFSKFTITKNGQAIGTTDWTQDFTLDIDNNKIISSSEIIDDSNYIRVKYLISGWSGLYWRCTGVANTFTRKFSSNAFDIDVQVPNPSYFVGQNVPLKITLINNVNEHYIGQLNIKYEMPTFFGDITQVQSKNITINPGINIYEYIIPTERVTERLIVTPSINVKYETISGVMKGPGIFVKPDDYNIGSIQFESHTVMLNPLPLVIELNEDGLCEYGYTRNSIGTYCISDKVKELSCYQIGCPVVNGSKYQCTSAGICAETVYITVWGDCPDGTNETYNAADQKICVDERLFETITQCSADSDCLDPCEGVVSACILGRCEYQGTCKVLSQLEIKEIIKQGEPEIRYVEPEFDYTKYYLVGLALIVLGFVIAMKIKVLKK